MSPVSHFLIGWLTANAIGVAHRERLLITVAGIAPDVDGLGIIGDYVTRTSASPLHWWGDYHHVLGHNISFGICLAAVSFFLAKQQKGVTVLFVLISFHLHLLCDLLGSRGPDGYQWPIPYLLPFSKAWSWTWQGQWALNAWPNLLITLLAMGLTCYLAWLRAYSPLGLISRKIDEQFVAALRLRFGKPDKQSL
ncbi:metal-dependent hydrolase [Candidatus Electronema sp. PJ]|uniref:metal-dependent hydrolase n=1 Tax=Candidatus Electronema sp. PJ TaxID=3401572 RepID=UPI003AA8E008